jgi:hypothetical protein
LDKFAKNLEAFGASLKSRGEEIQQAVHQISSETDIKIFIETNKSSNPFL